MLSCGRWCRYARCESAPGPSPGLAYLARRARLHGSPLFALRSPWLSVVLATWSPLVQFRCHLLLLLVLRLDKSFSALNPVLGVIASQYVLSLIWSSGACFSLPLIILLDYGIFPQYSAPSLQTLLALARQSIPFSFFSLFGYRVSFRSPLSRSFLSLLRASSCASTAPQGPSELTF